MRTSKLLLSDMCSLTGDSSDKSQGDSLIFELSALRGVSYALTLLVRTPSSSDVCEALVNAL